MSSQKGNLQRTRPQKHANSKAFKNDLHDTTIQTKKMNQLQVSGVCPRCADIINWKIKYHKYKALTQPKKCTKCEQRTVHFAYHIICIPCANKNGICGKCGKQDGNSVLPNPADVDASQKAQDLKDIMKLLPERKRRTVLRSIEKNIDVDLEELRKHCRKKETLADMEADIVNDMDELELYCSDNDTSDAFSKT